MFGRSIRRSYGFEFIAQSLRVYVLRMELIGVAHANCMWVWKGLSCLPPVDGRITSMIVFIDPPSVSAVPSFLSRDSKRKR